VLISSDITREKTSTSQPTATTTSKKQTEVDDDDLTYISEPDDDDNTFGKIIFVYIKYCRYMRFLTVEDSAEQTQADISSDSGANSGIRESGSENESTTASIDESSSSYGNKKVKG